MKCGSRERGNFGVCVCVCVKAVKLALSAFAVAAD